MTKDLNIYQKLKDLQNMSPEEWEKFLEHSERLEDEAHRKIGNTVGMKKDGNKKEEPG
jgi:phage terminase large subunit-like protein